MRDGCKNFGGDGGTKTFSIMSAEHDGGGGGGGGDDICPISVILAEEEIDKLSLLHNGVASELQHHFIRSINSTLAIRQLPSRGLSFQLWPAATTLVKLLDEQRSHPETSPLTPTLTALRDGSDRRTLEVLEIGSGTGLVGIAAAATLGAIVTVTDLSHVIPNLQFNVEANAEVLAANGGRVQVAPLHWGEAIDTELIGREFELVLASDVVYHDHLYDPLLQTLRSFLLGGGNPKMVFLMAHLRRWKKDSAFFKKARKLFEVEVLHTDPPPPGARIGVVVYRFAARQSKKSAVGSANEGKGEMLVKYLHSGP
ncbi:protein N-lysine methyltransferase METTL21A-like [Momordica charantia]|uniref:Protein N-lysine methyltransferase METTL21A-like n=1 Tax=Momordica charantia TaxID=3673 RepID=A0A6J1BUP4_MOMCH|nr:protein N-lysine methyltransferase METTL21A-like [Momordica charantia]